MARQRHALPAPLTGFGTTGPVAGCVRGGRRAFHCAIHRAVHGATTWRVNIRPRLCAWARTGAVDRHGGVRWLAWFKMMWQRAVTMYRPRPVAVSALRRPVRHARPGSSARAATAAARVALGRLGW